MSWALWITGLPGSGKSVLARAAAERLRARGVPVVVLELDAIRKVVTPTPTYSDMEREAVYRLLAFTAATLTESGVPVIVDATAHRRRWRALARTLIPCFAEVQLDCPLALAQAREASRAPGQAPRGIYARAGQAGATVPGVDQPYERALAPELVVDTAAESVAEAAERIAALAGPLEEASPSAAATGPAAWALWITGLPGSGKTTIAQRVAGALGARGIAVTVLDAAAVREFIDAMAGPDLEDMVHRALVCAAKYLTDAGVSVIVDATAPRRRWRALARELIARFAEVQLHCPPEVCAGRERAVRWRLPSAAGARVGTEACPAHHEIVTDYEPSLCPELTCYTDVQDHVTVVDAVLFVAERLHHSARLDDQENR
jgi:adenylylsulfate kinase